MIEAAARRLDGVAVRTPVLRHHAIDAMCSAEVHIKAENLQRTGAFKFRGGYNAVSQLSPDELAAGVVTYSSGNHAQAIAMAATMCGSNAVIVMPADAPASKTEATRAAGGVVVPYDRYGEDRVAIGREIAARDGRILIPPYDHHDVMAGQGTAGLELADQVAGLDAVFACLGGGGLLAGVATAFADRSPSTAVYGVEPAASDDHVRSRAAGHRVEIDVPRTIADGQALTMPGALTWPVNQRLVTDFVTVTDDEIRHAMRVLFDHVNVVAEPSGASALAAVLSGAVDVSGMRVGVTISGGNIDRARFFDLVG